MQSLLSLLYTCYPLFVQHFKKKKKRHWGILFVFVRPVYTNYEGFDLMILWRASLYSFCFNAFQYVFVKECVGGCRLSGLLKGFLMYTLCFRIITRIFFSTFYSFDVFVCLSFIFPALEMLCLVNFRNKCNLSAHAGILQSASEVVLKYRK